MRTARTRSLALAALAALVLPVASDQALDPTCNATITQASAITDPVNGDDSFFKQVNPGSNVMLMLDTSGSMAGLPQCTDNTGSTWSGTTTSPMTACATPAIPTPAGDTSVPAVVTGSCLPGTDTNLGCKSGSTSVACTGLKWMEKVVPKASYADAGFGGNEGVDDMYDCPPWGNGGAGCTTKCSGDSCLYDPNAYYAPGAWEGSQTGATRWKDNASAVILSTPVVVTSDGVTKVEPGCLLRDGSGKIVPDARNGLPIALPGCSACMASHGFFMFNALYYTSFAGSTYSSSVTRGPTTVFSGTFLNANPPKVLTGRNVMKQLLWMTQDGTAGQFDTVRFGLTTFGGLKFGLVPTLTVLNATYNKADWRKARNPILQYFNNRTLSGTTYVSTSVNLATGGTPLAATLLDVGSYFSETNTATTPANTYFASTSSSNPKKSSWSSYLDTGFVPKSAEACAVCFPACQKNSVIILTDGAPDNGETLPTNITATTGTSSNAKLNTDFLQGTGCPAAACDSPTCSAAAGCSCPTTCVCPKTCDSAGNGIFGGGTSTCCPDKALTTTPTPLPRVADWLHSYNLWPTRSPNSPVTLSTYVIGFNLSDASANVVHATGALGGGASFNATNATQVANAVNSFVAQASLPETSFSAPSVDTLQTTQSSTSDAFLTRFIPNSTNTWEGHVFQAALFDEFGNGCDTTKTVANQTLVSCLASSTMVNPDLDLAVDPVTGKAVCNKVFLVDQNCVPIGENTKQGGFFELDGTGAVTNIPAVLPWDAGAILSDRTTFLGKGYRSACQGDSDAPCLTSRDTPRNIFTWLPGASGAMAPVSFTTANVATLKPYLSIDPAWCDQLLTTIAYSPLPADKLTECAKQIIYFVRGYDIFNAGNTGCRGPGHPANAAVCKSGTTNYGTERNRDSDKRSPALSWKLGDIYHSTPVAAHMPASILTCDLGYDGQCLTTLHSPSSLPQQTRIKQDYPITTGGTMDAWSRYRLDNVGRARVVIVGANDGMLHGFDSGLPITDSTKNSPNALGNYLYTDGSGEELWAFIPPDLLPKLWRLVKYSTMEEHQYMVDGPTMVRDIWVDGSNQSNSTLAGKNGVKESAEYHTIAVSSERTGGNSYTALDITNPAVPRPLWTFPQPGSPEARQMGYSWTDFSGRPPPIGPVRVAFKTSTEATAQDPDGRGFEERWVVMINGGYDPTLVRGRAVFMVDAWTGQTLWRVTDDDLKTGGLNDLGFGSGTSMSSVPGSVALMDIGDTTKPAFDADGFFDTATWGDVGGNLWVARFQEIGQFGASGRVENWFAARTLEQGRVAANTQNARTRQPFFQMTSNAYEPTTRTLRTYLGSGNREQLTSQGATCGQDNLIGCCQSGCQVSATVSESLGGTCGWSSTFACDASGNMTHAAVADSPTACTTGTSCAAGGTSFTANASVTISGCPGTTGPTTATGAISCDATGTCTSPSSTPAQTQLGRGTVSFNGTTPPPPRFFAVWAYGKDGTKMFSTLPSAQTFDQNRFTDSASYAGTCTGGSTSCKLIDTTSSTVTYNPAVTGSFTVSGAQATVNDPGWFYQYQGGNEKTGAGSTVVLGCAVWSGFVATGTVGTNSCGGSGGSLTSRAYLSNYVTGVPSPSCGYADGTSIITRFTESQGVTAPPTTANVRVVINASGKVEYSALQLAPGGTPASKAVGSRSQVVEPVYWMEVSRDLHNCRHDSTLSVSTCK